MMRVKKLAGRVLYGAALVAFMAMPGVESQAADPVLTVSAPAGATTEADIIALSIDDIKAMPEIEILTSTIWTKGVHSFKGISLHALLEKASVTGSSLRATAANNYSVQIPISDVVENGPIVAYEMDGKALTIRDKGPLWIIYPYDHDPKYQTEAIYSRSIWQLVAIEIVP